jgi:hypothetical protein
MPNIGHLRRVALSRFERSLIFGFLGRIVFRLGNRARCTLLYHPLRIYSPGMAALYGELCCPICLHNYGPKFEQKPLTQLDQNQRDEIIVDYLESLCDDIQRRQ